MYNKSQYASSMIIWLELNNFIFIVFCILIAFVL